jgi:hypothetical protein
MRAALATACCVLRNHRDGLRTTTAGLNETARTSQAESYRLTAELRLIQDSSNLLEAETGFRTAINVARQQSAKPLELRAPMSLARLLDQTGHCDEARGMLAEIYNWFTEGLDTADLKDAKLLLAQLAG